MKEKEEIDVPTIDLTPFYGQSLAPAEGGLAEAENLFRAAERYGFFYVSFRTEEGSGVSEVTDPAFRAAAELFALPQIEKNKIVPTAPKPGAARGYLGCGEESGGDAKELKEQFSYARDLDAPLDRNEGSNDLLAPNVWPLSRPMVSIALRNFLDDVAGVSFALSRAIGLALGDSTFESLVNEQALKISNMRVFHYFPDTKSSPDKLSTHIGSSSHTDWGLYTIIARQSSKEEREALEVLVDGMWRSVPASDDGKLLVNCGDYLQLRTGGRWKSPVHRVVLTSHERTSFVFFQYPPYDTPMPLHVSAESSHSAGRKLSILQDQSGEGSVRSEDMLSDGRPFGAVIAAKWQQVARSIS